MDQLFTQLHFSLQEFSNQSSICVLCSDFYVKRIRIRMHILALRLQFCSNKQPKIYRKKIFVCTFKNDLRSFVLSGRIYQAVRGYNDSLNVAFIRSFSQDNNKTVYKLLLFADMNE